MERRGRRSLGWIVAGVALFGLGLWAFSPSETGPSHTPGASTANAAQAAISKDARRFTVYVEGTPNLPIAVVVTGPGSAGKQKFTGIIPQAFEFQAAGTEAVTISSSGAISGPEGVVELTVSKDGKVIAKGQAKPPQKVVRVTVR